MAEKLTASDPEIILDARYKVFDQIWNDALTNRKEFIDYQAPYPKKEFLEYLVTHNKVLLHGSNWSGLTPLEPRQANCRSKKFGNLNAVYATQDAVLPLFHAIRDSKRFTGRSASGYTDSVDGASGKMMRTYNFNAEERVLALHPWSDGVVYILPRDLFEQGEDDRGELIDEFVSRTPVQPITRLQIRPEDFPYLNDVQPIK